MWVSKSGWNTQAESLVAYSHDLMVFKWGFGTSELGLLSTGMLPMHLPSFPAEILLWQKCQGKCAVSTGFREFTLPDSASVCTFSLSSSVLWESCVRGTRRQVGAAQCCVLGSRRWSEEYPPPLHSGACGRDLAKHSRARSKASLVENTKEKIVVFVGSVKS